MTIDELERLCALILTAVFTSLGVMVIGVLWYVALLIWLRAAKEQFWIAAWLFHCRGNREAAKRALRRAIREEGVEQ